MACVVLFRIAWAVLFEPESSGVVTLLYPKINIMIDFVFQPIISPAVNLGFLPDSSKFYRFRKLAMRDKIINS